MGLHRRAAKRDDNEPQIRAAFARHGWNTETMSAPGMPDLLVWPSWGHGGATLVDVKAKDGKPTKAQCEKWAALAEKGIPVYVVRTERDVDALVRGELQPWHVLQETLHALALPPRSTPVDVRTRLPGKGRKEWRPPQSVPVDAAKEAEATFAPHVCETYACHEPTVGGARFCAEHTP